MGSRNHKKKIVLKRGEPQFENAFLLGSSADTVMQQDSGDGHSNHHQGSKNRHLYHSLNLMHIQKKQAYDYAILNDDIAEEAALLSSSEGGYDAELDDDRQEDSTGSVDLNSVDGIDDRNYRGYYMSTVTGGGEDGCEIEDGDGAHDDESVLSEVSDSVLLLEEREFHVNMKWHKRPSVFMISCILFFYCYSSNFAMAPELQLVLRAVCYMYNGNNLDNCGSTGVQQANASVQKRVGFVSSIVKILISSRLGKFSDIYGRKPVILFTFTMTALSKFSMMFILTPQYFSFGRYLAGSLLDAFGGSIFVLLGLANSYTIDVVHDKDRLQALGKVTGALFLGLALGPLSSSMLSSLIEIKGIHFLGLSTALMVVSILVVIFFIPESRSTKLKAKSRRSSIRSQRELETNPSWVYTLGLSTFLESFNSLKLLWITRPLNFKPNSAGSESSSEVAELLPPSRNKFTSSSSNGNFSSSSNTASANININNNNGSVNGSTTINVSSSELDFAARINVLLLLAVEVLMNFCITGASTPLALYLIYTFELDQAQLSLFVGVSFGFRALVLTAFNPWLQHHFTRIFDHDSFNVDFIDVSSIGFAIACELVAALLCSCSVSVVAVCFYVFFSSTAAIGSPILHSALLKYNSSPGKNGEFFGALALIRNITNLISPWMFLSVYSFGINIGKPQIIFYIVFVLFTISAFLLGNLRFKSFH
ncbi:hypothetical protein PICMEDRAFT_10537 [Pichia membranifaciens NRRL Y-2026]|uniref:Major facilitator superfamily (MFS) profile domain-containing protein n=1 Tax=Pichia membranifaciens NRRL Y-2026 TaxID=763406 RepID=A0A1E3NPT1_9ASCO|nr:hypothetical protein PICMEDRAFT_10537 [Pichia membranifaciens NRRL Y-2026]ODQ47553.1 hypothetical protein PICMEDRAFT_10537 [Pichia membranifaciens NRRL Y-2026]